MESYKCGYCNFFLGNSVEATVNKLSIHSCLAVYDQVTINDGLIYGYKISDHDKENELVSNSAINEGIHNRSDNGKQGEISSDKWSHEEILLLIDAYETHRDKLISPQYNKKKVWTIISDKLREHNVLKTPVRCDEKWRNLKKQYEKILKINSGTGSERKTWIYFERLHDILFKNPSINPPVTLSSTGCLKIQERKNNTEIETETNNESKSEDVPKPKKPRKETKEEAKERRHREKLEQREKFFNWVKEKEAEDNNRCQIT